MTLLPPATFASLPAPGTATPLDEAALAQRLFDGFRALSADPVAGITRPAYGPEETACLALVAETGAAHGLLPAYDATGNLWLSPPGLGDAPAPACGSHMDSVPQGGNFDGGAGVVAGLLCAIRAHREGWPLRALALRGEESPWFGAPHVGARAAFGAIGPTEMATPRRGSGLTLARHLETLGASPAIAGGGLPVPEVTRTTILYELHIEQGPVLEDRGYPAAAVTAVRGHLRFPLATCTGEAGHSGVVPRYLRHDPMMAVAELLHDLDTLWRRAEQEGADLVITAGQMVIDPARAAPTRVPDAVTFSLDLRSAQPATLEDLRRFLSARCAEIGRQRGVAFDLGRLVEAAPVMLDEPAREAIAAATPHGFTLVSGAGHDAAEFARRGVPGAMIFVRNQHGSHNPAEAMEMGDFLEGVGALYAAMRKGRPGE